MQKIYIAGPDVFEEDSIQIGQKYSIMCQDYGFIGLYPLDNIVNFSQAKKDIAKDIYLANVELIEQADIIIANLNSFRGKEPDSGTVWECGYAMGLHKKIYGYMSDTSPYLKRFNQEEKKLINSRYMDLENKEIENFSLPLNLMISCSCIKIIEGDFEAVLKDISQKQ